MADESPKLQWVTTKKGEARKVRAEGQIIGAYFIHKQLDGPQVGWTVTHLASGFAVWKTLKKTGSVNVAEELARDDLIPDEISAEDLPSWVRENEEALKELKERLEDIAPRWCGLEEAEEAAGE